MPPTALQHEDTVHTFSHHFASCLAPPSISSEISPISSKPNPAKRKKHEKPVEAPRRSKSHSQPPKCPQAADQGMAAATRARAMKEGPLSSAASVQKSPQLLGRHLSAEKHTFCQACRVATGRKRAGNSRAKPKRRKLNKPSETRRVAGATSG